MRFDLILLSTKQKDTKVSISAIYSSSSIRTTYFLYDYENVLEKLSFKSKKLYILKEFNIDTEVDKKLTRSFIHLNQSNGFSLIDTKAPTRTGETRESCIGNVNTNRDLINENSYVLAWTDLTDHYTLSHVTSFVLVPSQRRHPFVWRRDLRKISQTSIQKE